MFKPSYALWAFYGGVSLLLSACSGIYGPAQPTVYAPSSVQAPPVTEKRKTGNPYQVMGKWYTPLKTSDGYRQKGIASWYGKEFHGKKTANGEIYNMYTLTAAHTTLPLPTYARVTNLENGRHITVKVNDRGPFLRGRLIDMSYAAAQALGFAEQGTAPVLVEAYPQNGAPLAYGGARQPVRHGGGGPAAAAAVRPTSSFTNRVSQRAGQASPTTEEAEPSKTHTLKVPLYVQTGSFSNIENAQKQKETLGKLYNNTQIALAEVNNKTFYRVRIGPLSTVDIADQVLAKLIYEGYKEALLVLDD